MIKFEYLLIIGVLYNIIVFTLSDWGINYWLAGLIMGILFGLWRQEIDIRKLKEAKQK